MGWNEWPLVLFTVLAQCAVGAYWLCVLVLFTTGGRSAAAARLERLMVAVLAVQGLAFLFSSIHVGSPLRGANVLLRLGHASLSNEVFFGAAFLAAGGLAWLLTWRGESALRLRKPLYILALALSVAFLWNMIGFYLMPTVPTWDTPLTPLAFLVTAVLGGAMLANLLFAASGLATPRLDRLVAGVAACGLGAGVVAAVSLLATLPGISSSVQSAVLLSPDIGMWQAVRFVFLFVAVGLVLRQAARTSRTMPAMAAALVLVACGEIIGRGLFYALHMTVGLV
jgi:anaerobic dimethyl sulfoxide reductase subunit C